MSVLHAIILGIIQGVTEFLPISSFGHLYVVENMLGSGRVTGTLFECMLHLGTLVALFFVFKKDLKKIGVETIGMLWDCVGNINLYIHNRKTGEHLHYTKIVTGAYRKFAAMVMVSMIPTMLIGYTARRLVTKSLISTLIPGIGFLLTAIVLLVIDVSRSNGNKGTKEMTYDNALWIGIGQGLSVFPGISRSALTVSVGILCGLSRNFAIKYSYILSIPAIIGSFFVQASSFTAPSMSVGLGFTYFLGMLFAAVTGYFTIRLMLKLFQKVSFKYFAIYCFIVGFYALSRNIL